VPLPVKVRAGEARASYRDGVLRIELPKAEPARPQRITLKMS
jgi:HSP20 family protein